VPKTPVNTEPFTVTGWFFHAVTAREDFAAVLRNDSTNDAWRCRLVNAADELRVVALSRDNVSEFEASSSGATYALNTWNFGAWVFVSSTERRAYLNGTGEGVNTDFSLVTGIQKFAIGAWSNNAGIFNPMTGRIGLVQMYDRVLNPNEIQQLYLDPLAAFRLLPTFTPSLVVTGEVLVAESGAFALTGTNANLLVGHVIDADSASFTLTGTVATLLVGSVIDADSGTFTLTGTNANLVTGEVLVAESGSFALIGQDATLIAAEVLVAESGSFALTGQDAELIPPAITLVAESGSFALAGQDATLSTGVFLTAESGTFTLAGQDATLLVGHVLSADSGSFTLIGQDVFLLEGQTLSAEFGTFALAGTDATLAAQFNIVAESGTFTLTGTDADVFRTQSVADVIVAKRGTIATKTSKLGRIGGGTQAFQIALGAFSTGFSQGFNI